MVANNRANNGGNPWNIAHNCSRELVDGGFNIQSLKTMVRPARFERATYRFVARAEERADHHQDGPSTTKDGESRERDGEP